MTEKNNNILRFYSRWAQAEPETPRTRRAEAEHRRWLEIWSEAWTAEVQRRGKLVAPSTRQAFAARIRVLVKQLTQVHGARAGKITAVLEGASASAVNVAALKARNCPKQLLGAASKEREYRIDRFTSANPKNLRGKLADWLWVVEAMAKALGRDPRREVIFFYDEARLYTVRDDVSGESGLGDEYDAIFEALSERLNGIATSVARKFDVATYYECCEKMHAAWHSGTVIENDGWALRFNRLEFADANWVDVYDGSYSDNPVERSPLGPVGELLIHAPIARVTLSRLHVGSGESEDIYPGFYSLEFDVHLAIRPDVDDSRQSAALLVHPLIAFHDKDLTVDEAHDDWWRIVPQVAIANEEGELQQRILDAEWPASDPHIAHARALARQRVGHMRLLPLSGDVCREWLSFGANDNAPQFLDFIWHNPGAVDERCVVSAPAGTIAGHIQFNLIMAAASEATDKRLDQLLCKDAERKVSAIRRLLAEKKTNYERYLADCNIEDGSEESYND